MKNIKVLGTGCANCNTTMRLIEEAAAAQGAEVVLEKVEDMGKIVSYGVMSTPGVVIDGKLIHAGGIPSKEAIAGWISEKADSDCCSGNTGQGGGCCG